MPGASACASAATAGRSGAYQGSTSPRQSRKPPLAVRVSASITPGSRAAATAGGCTSRPGPAKGADSALATVPGCSATHTASRWVRAS